MNKGRISLGEAVTVEDMKEIEARAIALGVTSLSMMEAAGKGVAEMIIERFKDIREIAVLAGTGNNGGDGFVAARYLALKGYKLHVLLLGSPEDLRTEEARRNWRLLESLPKPIHLYSLGKDVDLEGLKRILGGVDLIVDAMLGTGVRGSLREPYRSVVELINGAGKPIVAVDVPTGLNATTGEICGVAVKADYTVTFHRVKKGLLKAEEYAGEILIVDIGVPPQADIKT